MARFVMSNRRAGKFHESEKLLSRARFETAFNGVMPSVDVVNDRAPRGEEGRRTVVFEADPTEMNARAREMPEDVILEPEILHYNDVAVLREFREIQRAAPATHEAVGKGKTFSVTVVGGGQPLDGAKVIIFLRGRGGLQRRLEVVSGANGVAQAQFAGFWKVAGLLVYPAGGFWSVLVRGPRDGDTIDCPPLPAAGPLAWWHETMGIDAYLDSRGAGVKVGVIDTGVGPHPNLGHATDIGAFID